MAQLNLVVQSEDEIIARALSILEGRLRKPGCCLGSPKAVVDYLMLHLADKQHEAFYVLYLDAQNCLIECREMFRGTINEVVVYPREVLRHALHVNAASVLFAHNHPSGHALPSVVDNRITARLIKVLSMAEIKVHDHIIVAGTETFSYAQRGKFNALKKGLPE